MLVVTELRIHAHDSHTSGARTPEAWSCDENARVAARLDSTDYTLEAPQARVCGLEI